MHNGLHQSRATGQERTGVRAELRGSVLGCERDCFESSAEAAVADVRGWVRLEDRDEGKEGLRDGRFEIGRRWWKGGDRRRGERVVRSGWWCHFEHISGCGMEM